MTISAGSDAAYDELISSNRLTFGWALRRALLGIVILFVFVGGLAWLLHTSIEPTAEAGSPDTTSAIEASSELSRL